MRNPRRFMGVILLVVLVVIIAALLAFWAPGPGGNPSGESLEEPSPAPVVQEPAAGGNPSGEPLEEPATEPEPADAAEEDLPATGGP